MDVADVSNSVGEVLISGRDPPTVLRDAWPVQRQNYGCLPSLHRYQIILIGDRGTRL